MDILQQLRCQLETIEFWIKMHYGPANIRFLEGGVERMMRMRHRVLKRILRVQIERYNRD